MPVILVTGTTGLSGAAVIREFGRRRANKRRIAKDVDPQERDERLLDREWLREREYSLRFGTRGPQVL